MHNELFTIRYLRCNDIEFPFNVDLNLLINTVFIKIIYNWHKKYKIDFSHKIVYIKFDKCLIFCFFKFLKNKRIIEKNLSEKSTDHNSNTF